MPQMPGPLCAFQFGWDWIDRQTLSLTRMPAPAEHLAEPARSRPQRSGRNAHQRHRSRHASHVPRTSLSTVERSLLSTLEQAGVTDHDEQAMFLAQVAHESASFTHLRENLHYSAARLRDVFPKKFSSTEDARQVLAEGDAAVAERIYGHRKNLGNTQDGDGGRYRGRGYIQLTGRANYEAAGRALGLDLIGQPDLAERPDVAARVAVWFWTRDAALRAAGKRGDVEAATRIVNGGLNGLADRRARFKEYQHLLDAEPFPAVAPALRLP